MPRISWLLPAALILTLPGRAWADLDKLREAYFTRDWAQTAAQALPLPTQPAEPADEGPIHVEHAQIAHMYITRQAFEIYMAHYPDSELAKYIGDYADGRPSARDDGNVVAGSYDEDEPHYTPFDDLMPFNRHFWNFRGGPRAGLAGFDSSVNRAHKYFSGGYGLDGAYDKEWSENKGKRRGSQGHGAVYLYQHGEKAKAYWYLGHAVHLIEDLTIPAHAHLWAHVVAWEDAYETYMEKAHVRWPALTSEPVESFDSLLDLFSKTARVTDRYDAGYAGGFSGGVDGSVDRGRRRSGGFTKEKLDEEASVLMPLAFRRSAALYRLFYKQVDKTTPAVELESPVRAADGTVPLKASAHDGESGVDRDSLRYYSSSWRDGAWTAWEPAPAKFPAAAGRLYRFKAAAQDAAGNIGESAPKLLPPELLSGLKTHAEDS